MVIIVWDTEKGPQGRGHHGVRSIHTGFLEKDELLVYINTCFWFLEVCFMSPLSLCGGCNNPYLIFIMTFPQCLQWTPLSSWIELLDWVDPLKQLQVRQSKRTHSAPCYSNTAYLLLVPHYWRCRSKLPITRHIYAINYPALNSITTFLGYNDLS